MSLTSISSIPTEVLATELYQRVGAENRIVVIGSNIQHINRILDVKDENSNRLPIDKDAIFIVLNTGNFSTSEAPDLNLGKYIEIVRSRGGRRLIKRVRKDIEKQIRKYIDVFGVGYVSGEKYLVAIDIYNQDPNVHKQIVDSIGGVMDDFVFHYRQRTGDRMHLEHASTICALKSGRDIGLAHEPDGTISFRIHLPYIAELRN
jgi:hypothetical protein